MAKIPWNKGKKWSKEIRQKMSLAKKGKPLSEERRKKMKGRIPWNKGKKGIHLSPKSEFKKGYISWWKGKVGHWAGKKRPGFHPWEGKKMSEEAKRKISESHSGEKHYRWNPNREEVMKNQRNDGEYKQWRLKVLKRDNYMCFDCGEIKKGQMEADHILGWAEFPRLRYDINNGQTLCKDCHKVKTVAQLKKSSTLIFTY